MQQDHRIQAYENGYSRGFAIGLKKGFIRGFCGSEERAQRIVNFINAYKVELFIFGLAVASLAFGPWPTTMLVSKKVLLDETCNGIIFFSIIQILNVSFGVEGLAGKTGKKIQALFAVMVITASIADPSKWINHSLYLLGLSIATNIFTIMHLYADDKRRTPYTPSHQS